MDYLDLEVIKEENPTWVCRNFDDLGYFIGPKKIAVAVEEALEELRDD